MEKKKQLAYRVLSNCTGVTYGEYKEKIMQCKKQHLYEFEIARCHASFK